MSWSRAFRAFALRGGLITFGAALAGCVQPLYTALGPGVLEKEMQSIKIEPIPDRFGHYLEKELLFAFNGTGSEVAPKYRLVVTVKQRVQAPTVDTVTSRATSATVIADAEYRLFDMSRSEPVARGVAFSVASYDRFSQRISNVQAARDAEVRDARTIAEQIRVQISARLAARSL